MTKWIVFFTDSSVCEIEAYKLIDSQPSCYDFKDENYDLIISIPSDSIKMIVNSKFLNKIKFSQES